MIVNLFEENGELILPIPDCIFESLGWQIDDVIEWVNNNDGTFTLRKKDNNHTNESEP